MSYKESAIEISIIIPTNTPGGYLFECLNSIILQKYELQKLEVILVLNGPKDPYFNTIENYVHQNSKLNLVLTYCDHAHVSAARNMGLKMAQGDYVVFMDDDDLLSPTFIQELISSSTKNGVVFSNVMSIINSPDDANKNYLSDTFDRNMDMATHNWMTLRSHMSVVWGKLFPFSMIKDDSFNLKFKNGQDALFMALISHKIKEYSLTSPDAIYYWRDRSNSASRKSNKVSYEIKNTMLLMYQYMRIYTSAPHRYNIFFFMSRILAVLKRLRYRIPKSSW